MKVTEEIRNKIRKSKKISEIMNMQMGEITNSNPRLVRKSLYYVASYDIPVWQFTVKDFLEKYSIHELTRGFKEEVARLLYHDQKEEIINYASELNKLINEIHAIGLVLKNEEGYIQMINYPELTPENLNINWDKVNSNNIKRNLYYLKLCGMLNLLDIDLTTSQQKDDYINAFYIRKMGLKLANEEGFAAQMKLLEDLSEIMKIDYLSIPYEEFTKTRNIDCIVGFEWHMGKYLIEKYGTLDALLADKDFIHQYIVNYASEFSKNYQQFQFLMSEDGKKYAQRDGINNLDDFIISIINKSLIRKTIFIIRILCNQPPLTDSEYDNLISDEAPKLKKKIEAEAKDNSQTLKNNPVKKRTPI